jgi:aminopeptidase 2
VKDPSDINQIFDAISYSKGAAVIRMLESYLGASAFQKGLRAYLSRHKFGNARTTDLWAALAEASGKPVPDMMADWTRHIGYPVLHVEQEGTLGNSGCCLHLRQNRFLATGDVKADEDSLLWHIPVTVQSDAGEIAALMKNREERLALSSSACRYVKVNPGQTGFFRVHYSAALLEALGTHVAALGVADRVGILNDAFVLGMAGYSRTIEALSLLSHFYSEEEHVVWAEIASQLKKIQSVWFERGIKPDMDRFLVKLFKPLGIYSTK